tara:strand:+ start:434 stop:646 length:213 start_codon:yes stop_codon:yes gene_type:complete
MPEKKIKKQKQLNSYVKYSSLATQMAVIIAAGVFFGEYLDKTHTSEIPIYTTTFSFLSIFLSLYYVIKKA